MSLKAWLECLRPNTQRVHLTLFRGWFTWLQQQQSVFKGLNSDSLVSWQASHPSGYELVDLLQKYLRERTGRVNTKKNIYTAVRSFFGHNRAEMPRDRRFRFTSDEPTVVGRLPVDELRRVLETCNPMYRAVFLCMFQGGMGIGEFLYWNRMGLSSVREQLGRGNRLIRVELPGRKQNRNVKPYYTFLGGDAREALRHWLQVRPKGSDIFYTNFGSSLREQTVRVYWLRRLARLGLITRTGLKNPRYGKGLHEIRDTFRTRWRISGCDVEIAEFLMGHDIDKLGYDKSPWEYPEWFMEQYCKAEPWLNVLTEDPEKVSRNQVFDLQKRIKELERGNERARKLDMLLEDPEVYEAFVETLQKLKEKKMGS